MLDARTMDLLKEKSRYGEIRLYGAMSFGLLILISGYVLGKSTKNDESVDINGFKISFYLHIFLSTTTGFLVLFYSIFSDQQSIHTSKDSSMNEKDVDDISMISSSHNMLTDVEIRESHSKQEFHSTQDSTSQLGVLQVILCIIENHPEVISFATIIFLSGIGDGIIETFLFLRYFCLHHQSPIQDFVHVLAPLCTSFLYKGLKN